MKMKRLGETAVSPDGKWLAYSVTSVDLEKNTKTAELWVQAISGGVPQKLAVGQSGDGGPRLPSTGTPCFSFPAGRVANRSGWRISTRRRAWRATRKS